MLDGIWRFGLHQLLEVPVGAPVTLHYELRLFVYKPAGAFVSVPLKTARQVQPFQTEAVVEGEQLLTTTAPLALAPGGHALWLDVRARRETGIGQVLVTLDVLALTLE